MGAHAYFLQLQGENAKVYEALSRGELDAGGLDPKEHALLAYVEKLTRESFLLNAADAEALREHSWTDAEIAEAVYIGALFNFFNRIADAFGLEDPKYFELVERGENNNVPRA